MSQCLFSITETRNRCYRSAFSGSGLRSTVTDLKDGTVMHCWVPKARREAKPNLVLIHGFGANALWQWGHLIRHVTPHFNVYVPDLVFFGGSYSSRPERSERFQAECVVRVMEAQGVRRVSLVGFSYGGFVGYCMAAMCGEVVERVVVCGSGVCMEERDLKEGLFPVTDLDEAANILVPRTPNKLVQLVRYTFFKPPPLTWLPSCFLLDFIETMCRDYEQEKRELIKAIAKDRKLSDLPKISQPTLIIWGEHDRVFPLELGHRLKRHLGDNAQLVVIKNAGHAFNVEKVKEFCSILKSYLVDLQLPQENSPSNRQNNSNPV
uniref:2-hydroxy-6-oxo-2,4-heptadienoate hydrolase n=3 Tax=Cajanus cajan TaxID=3821 RepID=A0A151TZS1_CAJCA|nr:2-hydroxy-6-oxo-2,4-heptadienoate hydrolase [Cajanus cajan]